ncbi:hypothetical protein PHLGIDRAFT_32351 [Phlebiopsis gigantea 11061_1 CR5-6]|uniref:non-specific serine/threonine protein kinase n=1 Tax=Phlebiopsis gigantea (strain 11061_1 CR5-6) TaxID=745531 RepID=A0A0C3RQE0_PHLG1|nr:hypothetical protein PHLGIDRAFT_32351 [Phlebiopsis gigantea 11061_1 CR5-6]
MEYIFGGKYLLGEEVAVGGCGTVYQGVHKVAGKEVAIKVEPAIAKSSPLQQETKIYRSLQGGPGVPWMMWAGKSGEYNVMVIDLLGPSLEDLFQTCNRYFSLKTVLMLGVQLLDRIEYIHSRGLVHRDIKPANFVMSSRHPAESCVNVIDFGLAKKFRDPLTGEHIPYRQDEHHGVGTSLFASIHTHDGVEASRRDDLESLTYMLLYFLRGSLPWRKLRGSTTAATWALIRAKKAETGGILTVRLPDEFQAFHAYVRGLEFYDLPDYEGLRQLLRGLALREGIEFDGRFDWIRDRHWNERASAAWRIDVT